ncbi:metal transporter [Actinomadura rudentiformis]|uniref:Metal transporter n=1 Tax=Actinomadura rudentiformis TaxID=359158 RepID=A0A6H9YCK0_9ACTN|nr:metal transporter [Actinomadura rudentiformis]
MLVNAGLGVVFALGIAFTAYMLISSWGKAYWIYTTAVAVVVSTLALLRARQKLWTAVAGLVVTAVAVVMSLVVEVPQEPSPTTALALAVLVGSSIRTLPAQAAIAIAAGGAAVTALAWVFGPTAMTTLATLLMVGCLVTGPVLRVFASGAPAESPQPSRLRR